VRSVWRVRLPFVPGPSDVLHAVGDLRDGIAEALALVPRVGAAVGRMEGLLDQVSALLARVDGIVDRADATVDRARSTVVAADAAIVAVGLTQVAAGEAIEAVGVTQVRANEAIEAVGRTQAKADDAIEAVGRTTARADGTLTVAEDLVGRTAPLAADYLPALTSLAPSVRRLATTLHPDEVEALVTLIDRLPQLVDHLDQDILPVLESLGSVGTDVHDLVDTVQDLRQIVKGFPGSRLFRRRGAEEIAQEEAAESDGQAS
jgi:hypothetical protein